LLQWTHPQESAGRVVSGVAAVEWQLPSEGEEKVALQIVHQPNHTHTPVTGFPNIGVIVQCSTFSGVL
jgi:hypothetical protein